MGGFYKQVVPNGTTAVRRSVKTGVFIVSDPQIPFQARKADMDEAGGHAEYNSAIQPACAGGGHGQDASGTAAAGRQV